MEAVQLSILKSKGRIAAARYYNTDKKERTGIVSLNVSENQKASEGYTDAESAKAVAGLQLQQYAYQCAQEITEKIKELMDPTSGMSDAEKEKYDKTVMAKVYSGKELTPEELRYIRINYPALYPQVLRVQIQRKAFEERVKNCRSKQEVEEVYQEAMMRVSEDDPMREVLYAAYTDVYKEFKETDDYQELPEKTEEEENENEAPLETDWLDKLKNDIENDILDENIFDKK